MAKEDDIRLEYFLDKAIAIQDIGYAISDIINQDGDDKTDGEVIDEIIRFLEKKTIYKPRT